MRIAEESLHIPNQVNTTITKVRLLGEAASRHAFEFGVLEFQTSLFTAFVNSVLLEISDLLGMGAAQRIKQEKRGAIFG